MLNEYGFLPLVKQRLCHIKKHQSRLHVDVVIEEPALGFSCETSRNSFVTDSSNCKRSACNTN
jgi:hypothetical protein